MLRDQILNIGDLLLLVEAGIEQDELRDALVLCRGVLRLMRHLHRPGVCVDAEVAHAEDPGRVLLERTCRGHARVGGARRDAVHQLDVFRMRQRRHGKRGCDEHSQTNGFQQS